MSATRCARIFRWVGWILTVSSGLILFWLTASGKPSRLFWALFLVGNAISLAGLILQRSAKSALAREAADRLPAGGREDRRFGIDRIGDNRLGDHRKR